MKRNLVAMMVVAAGSLFAQYRDGYGQPGYGGGDPYDYRYDNRDGYYGDRWEVRNAPPPAPRYGYSYRRPPMPGPGFVWVDGHWGWNRGRYIWVSGFWMRPPFSGGYWVAPRYSRGFFYGGFWAGGRDRMRHGAGPGYGYRR